MKSFYLLAAMLLSSSFAFAQPYPMQSFQRIRLVEGNLGFLKNASHIKLIYRYDNMQVGNLQESSYVAEKVDNKNDRNEGAGDQWKEKWEGDRSSRFEPEFEHVLNNRFRKLGISSSKQISEEGHQYVMEVHTIFTDPGFNFGFSAYAMKGAQVRAVVSFYDKSNPSKILARLQIQGIGSVSQYHGYDVASRIESAYGSAARRMGGFVRRQMRMMSR